jgi:hypothetical protein
MVAEVRKRLAQVRICGGVPTGVLSGHALRLSNERFQVVDAHRAVTFKPLPMRTISEIWEITQTELAPEFFDSFPEAVANRRDDKQNDPDPGVYVHKCMISSHSDSS